jgi:hypothetical protein
VVLFVVSGVARNRGIGTKGVKPEPKATEAAPKSDIAGQLTATGPEPAKVSKKKKAKPADGAGEFDEIEDILKRHGIN